MTNFELPPELEFALFSELNADDTETCVMCESTKATCMVDGFAMCEDCAEYYIKGIFDSNLRFAKAEILEYSDCKLLESDLDKEFDSLSLSKKASRLDIPFEYMSG